MIPDDLPDGISRESEDYILPRDRLPIHDYHGLTVEEALLKFVTDYFQALRLPPESQQFRAVHGYGSTGHGGRIRKILRELLTFEMDAGALTFRESEYLDTHPGYTIISPLTNLHPISANIFSSPVSFRDANYAVRKINAVIDVHQIKQTTTPKIYPALSRQALDALNHVFDKDFDQGHNA